MEKMDEKESEAIYIIREAFSQFNNPVLLFSGGKDSLVLLHLARKAFWPSKIPFQVMHIDTGHNFKETIEFRDKLSKEWDFNLIVKKVQDSIDSGRVNEETGENASRNTLQTTTLLDSIKEFNFDCLFCGGRRDEEKARAKERIFSHRDSFGQWNPKNQRPELWSLFNGRKKHGEHFRVFPISNWTELDIWKYLKKENIELPSLYFSHKRKCVIRENVILAHSEYLNKKENELPKEMTIRFRTIGDMTCTGAIESNACNINEVIDEITISKIGERGSRFDDKRSDSSMEDRKREGYF